MIAVVVSIDRTNSISENDALLSDPTPAPNLQLLIIKHVSSQTSTYEYYLSRLNINIFDASKIIPS